jgi:hypothetical protein
MKDAEADSPISELWISLEDAVQATGVSRRNIQEWVRSGQIKREKRKGKVFLWVSDLTELTPLTRVDPETVPQPEPELLPTVLGPNLPSASIKVFGERLSESVGLQKQILQRLDDVQQAALAAGADKEPAMPLLDERTVKELSLLGNVFRSIHQQNEKVSDALLKQEQMLSSMGEDANKEERWIAKCSGAERRLGSWKLFSVFVGMLFLLALVSGFLYDQQQRELGVVAEEKHLKEKELLLDQVSRQEREADEQIAQKQKVLQGAQQRHERELLSMRQQHESAFTTLQLNLQQQLLALGELKDGELQRGREDWQRQQQALLLQLDGLRHDHSVALQRLSGQHQVEIERLREFSRFSGNQLNGPSVDSELPEELPLVEDQL